MSNTATGYTMTVTGNVVIDNNSSFKMNNSTGSCTMTIGGNFTLNSGYFDIVTGRANSTLSVAGDVNILGGTLIMNENDNVSMGTLNVDGNFTLTGGDINTQASASGLGLINFNGSTTQTYLKTGGTFSNTINFNVSNGSILDVGTSLIDGSDGTFNLNSGAGIITAHAQGLSTSPGVTGSIQVTGTKTFNIGADYTYNGSAAQVTGNGLTGANNLTINNNAGVTLSSAVSVAGTLTLTDGILTTSGANLLSISNTSNAAVSGGSATSFINGPVRWTLQSNMASGSTYNIPMGKGITYLPFSLVNPTTGAGAVTAQVEANTGNTGGTYDGTLSSISTTEYWSLITGGSFTNSSVSLTRQTAIAPLDAIGGSLTLGGAYTSLAGSAGTYDVTGSNAIGTNRFFVLAGRMQTITTGVISGSPFCAGANVSVPYTITGTFTAGNVFTAQLSDATGSFASPAAIGTLNSTTAGTISATIPPATGTGTLYRIRVVSSNPVRTGTYNGSDLAIYTQPVITTDPTGATVCYNATHTMSVLVTGGTALSYQWQVSPDGISSWTNVGTNSSSFTTPAITANSYYKVIVSSTGSGCTTPLESSVAVVMLETTKPVFTSCPSNVPVNSDAGLCTASVITSNPVFSDNCSVSKLTWVLTGSTTGSSALTGINYLGTQTFNLGTTLVTYTAIDAAGNFETCRFNVTVTDNEVPTVTSATDVVTTTSADGTGNCTVAVAIANAVFGDNCSSALTWVMTGAVSGNGSGQVGTYTFPIGVTTITYTNTDGAGLTATDAMTVTVTDNEVPTVTAATDVVTTTSADGTGNCTVAVAISNSVFGDNCSSALTWVMTGAVSGNGSGQVGTYAFPIGVTTITCPIDVTVSCEASTLPANTGTATATDICTPVGNISITSSDVTTYSVDPSNVLHYNYVITRTWRATDVAGNFSECTQTITVHDVTAPVITCPIDVTVSCEASTLPANTGTATATDILHTCW